ncbi:MAG: 3-phosphoshikimate 1-carboxyvinyltransferase [Candidatus Omnitrophica bacterium]|nr:3-phosphoshikimate 1-carboxyvinyltransferase [Candidatus Omnitrophota bacterium]MCM8776712.1 3-phosphoshikimate 1-carboxyvinyltransferase [Candidatus Omnitrophota bacterium]
MDIIVKNTKKLQGEVTIPGSKSHTIRGVVIGTLAEGTTKLINPLISEDTLASVQGCRDLGAKIDTSGRNWIIEGTGGKLRKPEEPLNLANSGTSLNLLIGVSSLGNFDVILDGDESLRTRPVQPLLDALNQLGASGISLMGNGKPPVKIKGEIKGGKTEVNGISSQFVSSLLISTPLAKGDTEIRVINIHEVPYIEMTLRWLDDRGIVYERNCDYTYFKVKGNQRYNAFEKVIPADWSSATFFLVAGAIIKDSDILLKGLDVNDVQGDKMVMEYLKKMGADIRIEKDGIRIKGSRLKGAELNLNNTPDALPAMAVCGCFAEGTTKIYNVAHARIKETDRIKVMTEELSRMGARIEEKTDGLIIHNSNLKGNKLNGHYDHRVVMALSLAGLIATGTTKITTAEAVSVTFPNFIELMRKIGANINKEG